MAHDGTMLLNQGRPFVWAFPRLVHPLPNTRTATSIPSQQFISLAPNLNSCSQIVTTVLQKPAELLTRMHCAMHWALHVNSNNCILQESFTESSLGWTASNVISTLAKHLIWVRTEAAGNLKALRQQRELSLLPVLQLKHPVRVRQLKTKVKTTLSGHQEEGRYNYTQLHLRFRCCWIIIPSYMPKCGAWERPGFGGCFLWFWFVSRASLVMWRWKQGLYWPAGATSFGLTFPAVLGTSPWRLPPTSALGQPPAVECGVNNELPSEAQGVLRAVTRWPFCELNPIKLRSDTFL